MEHSTCIAWTYLTGLQITVSDHTLQFGSHCWLLICS